MEHNSNGGCMNIDVRSAVNSLVPNNASHIENEKITLWESAETQPTEAEIDAEVDRLEAEYDAQKYARERASAYPSTGDQFDMMFKDNLNGTTTHKDAVEAIKTKWPKDNSGPLE